MQVTKRIVLLMFMILSPLFMQVALAQSKSTSPEKKQEEADKRKERQKQEELNAIEKGKKRHMKLQDKKTKKRMKKSKKKADRVNANKKPPFYERWWIALQRKKRG